MLLAGVVEASLVSGVASGDPITVANTNDSGAGSLRQAIIDAMPGETIQVPAGAYPLTSGELAVTKSLSIEGAGAATTIISNGGSSRVFHTSGSSSTIAISGVTIRLGDPVPVAGVVEGGGVLNEDAVLTLSDDVITDNHADADGAGSTGGGGIAEGGGVFNNAGTLVVSDTRILSNRASAVGSAGKAGGITAGGGVDSGGTETIEGSTFMGNTADSTGGTGGFGGISDGGGLNIDAGGSASLTASTFSGNVADASAGAGGSIGGIADGGGAFMLTNAPTMSAANVTFTGNVVRSTAGGSIEGGGFSFGSNGPVITLRNATITANTVTGAADSDGGDAALGGSKTEVENTIVSAGVGSAGAENCTGAPTSLGHNIDSLAQCNFTAAGDKVNTDPRLGPLHDNGGPAETLALEPGSPAIDAGAGSGCPATDERGVLRPAGAACDIGAFEVATPAATTGSASSITASSAVLDGIAFNPDLAPASAHLEYGTTTAYGSSSPSQSVMGTAASAPVGASIRGLAPNTLFHFRLVVSNAVGTAFGADQTFTTAKPPTPPPRITRLRLTPTVLTAASRGGAIVAASTGATVSYVETEAATTAFTILRHSAGRRQGHSCAKPTKRTRKHKPCTRLLTVGHFTHTDGVGPNHFRFSGRVGGHALPPGSYQLRAVPRSSAGAGSPANAGFRVKA